MPRVMYDYPIRAEGSASVGPVGGAAAIPSAPRNKFFWTHCAPIVNRQWEYDMAEMGERVAGQLCIDGLRAQMERRGVVLVRDAA